MFSISPIPAMQNCGHPILMVLNSDWSSLGCLFSKIVRDRTFFSLKFRLSHLPKYSLFSLPGQFWDSLYKTSRQHFSFIKSQIKLIQLVDTKEIKFVVLIIKICIFRAMEKYHWTFPTLTKYDFCFLLFPLK
jgi:hypothetical protein